MNKLEYCLSRLDKNDESKNFFRKITWGKNYYRIVESVSMKLGYCLLTSVKNYDYLLGDYKNDESLINYVIHFIPSNFF